MGAITQLQAEVGAVTFEHLRLHLRATNGGHNHVAQQVRGSLIDIGALASE